MEVFHRIAKNIWYVVAKTSFLVLYLCRQYFSKDKVFRQYFDDIYYLNEEINKRRKELKEEKEKEYKKYRNFNSANYYIKTVSGVQIIERSQRVSENDKIMAALFGNDISV